MFSFYFPMISKIKPRYCNFSYRKYTCTHIIVYNYIHTHRWHICIYHDLNSHTPTHTHIPNPDPHPFPRIHTPIYMELLNLVKQKLYSPVLYSVFSINLTQAKTSKERNWECWSVPNYNQVTRKIVYRLNSPTPLNIHFNPIIQATLMSHLLKVWTKGNK